MVPLSAQAVQSPFASLPYVLAGHKQSVINVLPAALVRCILLPDAQATHRLLLPFPAAALNVLAAQIVHTDPSEPFCE